MKQITFRELLNLMYEGKAPERIVYLKNGIEYQRTRNDYVDSDYVCLSDIISNDFLLLEMTCDYCIAIYEEILDDKEKEYLSNIIRPFKKYVKYIAKNPIENQERILIGYHDYLNGDGSIYGCGFVIALPTFKAGTMYKDMYPWREYTLEELGL